MRKIIKGDVNLANLHLTELFDLSDVEVTGFFHCNNNYLTSLKGAPKTVVNFYCENNNLTSLEGAPSRVDGNFTCGNNRLTNLKYSPLLIRGYLDCGETPLTSLEGIPKIIGTGFYISAALKDIFPEKYIRSLSDIQGPIHFV